MDYSTNKRTLATHRVNRDYAVRRLEEDTALLVEYKQQQKDLLQSRSILREVAMSVQSAFQFQLSDIVTQALRTVFQEDYEFKVEFVHKRNKTECELYVMKDGVRLDPIKEMGGGIVQVVAFALRISLFVLQRGTSRNMVVLDEPTSFLSADHQHRFGTLLQQIASSLGIQFVVVTHSNELRGDKEFVVTNHNNISKVVVIP